MKTRLLLTCFLFTLSSYVLFAQWTQVGNAQFTNFANNAAISFQPTNGEPYVVFDDAPNGNSATVLRYDGTNWLAVGGAISTEASANHAINFNPITNEPWVAYRRTNNNVDVYRFDGTNWIAVATNQGTNFTDHRLQIQFNAAGDARVAGRVTSRRLRILQFSGATIGSPLEEILLNSPQFIADQRYDFNSYNNYFVSSAGTGNSVAVARKNVGTGVGTNNFSFNRNGIMGFNVSGICLLYTSPSPRDRQKSRMPSSA